MTSRALVAAVSLVVLASAAFLWFGSAASPPVAIEDQQRAHDTFDAPSLHEGPENSPIATEVVTRVPTPATVSNDTSPVAIDFVVLLQVDADLGLTEPIEIVATTDRGDVRSARSTEFGTRFGSLSGGWVDANGVTHETSDITALVTIEAVPIHARPWTRVRLSAARPDLAISPAEFQISASSLAGTRSIGGTAEVTRARRITGRIVDASTGMPIVGARLDRTMPSNASRESFSGVLGWGGDAARVAPDRSWQEFIFAAEGKPTSDAEGRYAVSVPIDTLSISVAAHDYLAASWPLPAIDAGAELNHDFALHLDPMPSTLTIVARREDGSPAAGAEFDVEFEELAPAELDLVPPDADISALLLSLQGIERATWVFESIEGDFPTVLDERGEVTIRVRAPGRVRVRVDEPGGHGTASVDARSGVAARCFVLVGPATRFALRFTRAGEPIKDRDFWPFIRVDGALVRASRDEDGLWRHPDAVPGTTVRILPIVEGALFYDVHEAWVARPQSFDVPDGAAASTVDVDFEMRPLSIVRGRVRDASTGDPLRADVEAHIDGMEGLAAQSFWTDVDGEFHCGLLPGSALVASVRGFAAKRVEWDGIAAVLEPIDLHPLASMPDSGAFGAIRGRVTIGAGTPVRGAHVSVTERVADGDIFTVDTAADGTFEFAHLRAVEVNLVVQLAAFVAMESVSVPAGSVVDIDLSLEPRPEELGER